MDGSISLPRERDPLGLQPIWTALAGSIFNGVTTSVSNDIRLYTINLVHHLAVRNLRAHHPEWWIGLRERSSKGGISCTDVSLQNRLILAMELMLAYSAIEWNDSRGIIGVSIAKERWKEKEKPPNRVLDLSQAPTDPVKKTLTGGDTKSSPAFETLLVRQTGLGISGRYRGAFKAIGLLDGSGLYDGVCSELWPTLSAEIDPSYVALADELAHTFVALDNDSILDISANTKALELYRECFDKAQIEPRAREFWLEKMGFKTGSVAKKVFEGIVDEDLHDDSELASIDLAKSIYNGLRKEGEFVQAKRICEIEPFLTVVELVFSELVSNRQENATKLLPIAFALKERIDRVDWMQNLSKSSPGGTRRLMRLLDIFSMPSGDDSETILSALINYHVSTAQEKDNYPWISDLGKVNKPQTFIENGKKVSLDLIDKAKSLTLDGQDLALIDAEVPWFRGYYIESIRNIKRGMIGSELTSSSTNEAEAEDASA